MRLKSLEISGFKSFANKTVFSFPSSITAVIGPNGSGKSNVADAIRWVLGERDMKGLRVKKSEDVIFGGTPKKAKMSLAQVILRLDNKDRKLPVDFKEIEITRRLNRAGESEYLINNSQVRLKDVIELLAKAKIGYSGITIVNQGLADSIIKASPKERRAMIEENLGLREFQLKKEETIRKLSSTADNLFKTQALVDELLPHLKSLRRQVGRWEKREEIAEQLKLLEKIFFGSQFSKIFQSENTTEQKVNDLKKKIEIQENLLTDLEKEFENLENQRPDFSSELKEIQTEMEKLESQKSGIFRNLGNIEGQIEGLRKMAIASKSTNTTLPSHKELEKSLHEFRISLKRLVSLSDLSQIKKELGELINGLNHLLDGEPNTTKPIQILENQPKNPEVIKLEKEKEILNQNITVLNKQIDEFNKKLEELRKKDAKSGVDSRVVWSRLQEERRKLDNFRKELNDILILQERTKMRKIDLEDKLRESGFSIDSFSNNELQDFNLEEEMQKANIKDDFAEIESKIFRLRRDLSAIGEVDELLVQESKEVEERYNFLSTELADLEKAKINLEGIITELVEKIDSIFNNALKEISAEFNKYFRLMFGGGGAKLVLVKSAKKKIQTDEVDVINTEIIEDSETEQGIEFQVDLPKKKVNNLEALSGGERTLVSISALFAIVAAMDPPFAVLDEIDAALDEANARKFSKILSELATNTQFVMITHNRSTMESAQALFGVTMAEEGISKAISLKLEEV